MSDQMKGSPMDGAEKFWVCQAGWAAGVIATIAVSVTVYNVHLNTAKAAAIAAGVNPIDVMCAYESLKDSERAGVCTLRAK